MDETETPPNPRGVPFHVAVETLLDPQLVQALRAAEVAPLDSAPLSLLRHTWKPPKLVTLTEAERRKHLLLPPREALLAALRDELAAGRILCAGREKGAGATERRTFAAGDWQHPEALRTRDWQDASARINGRVYVDLVFWRIAAPAPRDVAPYPSTASAMPKTDMQPDPAGVPYQVALEKLTDPALSAEYRAANLDLVPKGDLRLERLFLNQKLGEFARLLAPVVKVEQSRAQLSEPDRNAIKVMEADIARAQQRIARACQALKADFKWRIRTGRILVSALSPSSPFAGRQDLDPALAAEIENHNGEPRIRNGAALTGVMYRAAHAVQPQAAPPIPPPAPAKRESGASRTQRLTAIVADIQARAAASPERPDETREEQFARLKVDFPGITNPEFAQARGVALAAYPAWKRAGRRAG